MKISCLPVAMFPQFINGQRNISQWALEGISAGLDGVDISTHFFSNHSPSHLAPIKRSLKESAANIVMVAAYPDFTNPDSCQRERELLYLSRDIALASELGARYVRVLAGQAHPGIVRSEGIKNAVDCLRRAAEIASRFGITLVYENHSKPSAWQYTDFSHPTDIFLEILRAVSDAGIKLNFDTANVIAYGDDTLDVLSKVIKHVETIHVADTSTFGKLTPAKIGKGIVPFNEIFAMLKSTGFDGWLCIEDCVSTTIDGIRESAEAVGLAWDKA